MTRISKGTMLAIGLAALVLPVAASAGIFENRQEVRDQETKDRQTERQTNMEDRQANRQENSDARQADRQAKFCDNFLGRITDMQSKLADRKSKFADRKAKRSEYMNENRDTRDNSLTDTRESQDARRNAWYEKLDAAADTDAKKAAVADFKKTTEAAVETRRNAINAAIKVFRDAVDATMIAKKDARTIAADTFAAAVTAAIEKAKSSCSDGTDPATVRSTFQDSLKSARSTLQSEQQGDTKLGDTIRTLAETRRKSVQAAIDAFKKTMEQAKSDMKKAFGETEVE